ncbi:MAG: hypothetical protein AAF609_14895 [Cyanobacteria bacterium P01_C01_bin.120]
MSQYSKFIKVFYGCAATYLLSVFTVNFIVDPYGIHTGGGRVNNDRLVKAYRVLQIEPRTVFLGASGVARGLDPDYISSISHTPIYNLSILGANSYELKHFFQYTNRHVEDLERVIVELNFFAFNRNNTVESGFSSERLNSLHPILNDFFGIYLSLDSLNLVLNPEERGVYFAEDGTYEHEVELTRLRQFETQLQTDFSKPAQMYWDYELSEEAIANFRTKVETSHTEGIDVRTFISPIHVTQFYPSRVENYWSTYERWVRGVVNIHPVWDFSGCNSITTEPIKDAMEYYDDPSHYTYTTGNLVLNRMFNHQIDTVPENFGVYVTPENVDEHLQRVRAQCQQWASENPEVVAWLGSLDLRTVHSKVE